MNKMAITTYLSIVTLNVNRLNASIKRQMGKEDVVHTYNGILHGQKKGMKSYHLQHGGIKGDYAK